MNETPTATGDTAALSERVRSYLEGLQTRITDRIADIDGGQFLADAWQKAPGEPLQGRGLTKILEDGAVFERAGCGFSHVQGPKLPPSATQHRPELAGAPFDAMGVSLVFHPRNPYVPTVHMNVRMLSARAADGSEVCWFGGHGPDPLLSVRGRCPPFSPGLQRRFGALWRRQIPTLQNLV